MLNILELIKEGFTHHALFGVGVILIVGFILGKIAEAINFPAITGYILAGIAVGEFGLGLIRPEISESLHIVSEMTLSFIALIIGGEFSVAKLRLYGAKVIIITLCQMLTTFALVVMGLALLRLPLYMCLLLGSIAAATAPAATVVIVEKLRARGPFVDYLYGVVALDDAGTVILFSIVLAFSSSMMTGAEMHITHSLLHALTEIGGSILIGVITGGIIHLATNKKRIINEIKIISVGLILLSTSIAISLGVSPLIANMTTGMLLINLQAKHIRIITALEPITPLFYALFFVIAGTEMDPYVFTDAGLLIAGGMFIGMRALGKYSGVYIPAALTKAPTEVKKLLGLALLPQAGVAIGLVLFVEASPVIGRAPDSVQQMIAQMVNIVLMAVFFNELVGPILSKTAIQRSMRGRS
jgi:Kef-type K+ transport system membrane component KefB